MLKRAALLSLMLACTLTTAHAQETQAPAAATTAGASPVYTLQVRVIFAQQTGFVGRIPSELQDMGELLQTAFDFPGYQLSNTIRLSTFADEQITTLLFPGHYLHVIPRGGADGNLAAKLELYHITEAHNQRLQAHIGNLLEDDYRLQVEEETQPQAKLPPVVSSALNITRDQWKAFGGTPVRVSAAGGGNSRTLSSAPLSANASSKGRTQHLILAVRLAPQ